MSTSPAQRLLVIDRRGQSNISRSICTCPRSRSISYCHVILHPRLFNCSSLLPPFYSSCRFYCLENYCKLDRKEKGEPGTEVNLCCKRVLWQPGEQTRVSQTNKQTTNYNPWPPTHLGLPTTISIDLPSGILALQFLEVWLLAPHLKHIPVPALFPDLVHSLT